MLTIAGIAATVAPIVMMTSCANKNPESIGCITLNVEHDDNGYFWSERIYATLQKGTTYKCILSLDSDTVQSFAITSDQEKYPTIYQNVGFASFTATKEIDGKTQEITDITINPNSTVVGFNNELTKGNYIFTFTLKQDIVFTQELAGPFFVASINKM